MYLQFDILQKLIEYIYNSLPPDDHPHTPESQQQGHCPPWDFSVQCISIIALKVILLENNYSSIFTQQNFIENNLKSLAVF